MRRTRREVSWLVHDILYTDDLATMNSPCYLEQKESSAPFVANVCIGLYL